MVARLRRREFDVTTGWQRRTLCHPHVRANRGRWSMLGEKLYEIQGQISGTRAVQGSGKDDVNLEVTFQGTGKILGTTTIENGTYVSRMKAPGVLYADGKGISITAEGEAIAWFGFGIGTPTGKGMGAKWRGSIHYSTSSSKF